MSTSKMNHARVFHPLKILQLLMLYRNRVTCITSVFWKKLHCDLELRHLRTSATIATTYETMQIIYTTQRFVTSFVCQPKRVAEQLDKLLVNDNKNKVKIKIIQ